MRARLMALASALRRNENGRHNRRRGMLQLLSGKNLGAWGDGGAVATNDEEVAHRVTSLSNHGRLSHYAHEICGYNSRLDSIQAAVLRAKLEKLDEWNQRRRVVAAAYRELLAPLDAQPILEPRVSNPATTCS